MGETDTIEWDDLKDASNRVKHGLSLILAQYLFDGRPLLQVESSRHGNARVLAIGTIEGVVLACVYVVRNGKRRIISLRPASRAERRRYATLVGRAGEGEGSH